MVESWCIVVVLASALKEASIGAATDVGFPAAKRASEATISILIRIRRLLACLITWLGQYVSVGVKILVHQSVSACRFCCGRVICPQIEATLSLLVLLHLATTVEARH